MKRVIAQDAYAWQKAFEANEVLRVGVNCLTSEVEERPAKIYRADPRVEEKRIKAVRELRQNRDNEKVKKALDEVKVMASLEATSENNMMPCIIEAVSNYATVGEICDVLREVWGEYVEPKLF